MTTAALVVLAIKISIALLVLSLGLKATPQDLIYVLRQPSLLLRSLFAMHVVMLTLVLIVITQIDLPASVKIALVVLAVSPVPPILPMKQQTAGGSESYTIGLLAAAALISIVLIPAAIALVGAIFSRDVHVPASTVAPVVLTSVLVPLVVGAVVNRIAPRFAARAARPVLYVAAALLVAGALPMLVVEWPHLKAAIGNGTLVALTLFTIVGVAVGHFLGGPDPDNRTTLALTTGQRHPAIALTIAGAVAPDHKDILVLVLWHLLIATIVTVPYVVLRMRRHKAAGKPSRP